MNPWRRILAGGFTPKRKRCKRMKYLDLRRGYLLVLIEGTQPSSKLQQRHYRSGYVQPRYHNPTPTSVRTGKCDRCGWGSLGGVQPWRIDVLKSVVRRRADVGGAAGVGLTESPGLWQPLSGSSRVVPRRPSILRLVLPRRLPHFGAALILTRVSS